VVNATPLPLYPREGDPVPTVQEAGWAPGPFWTGAENNVGTEVLKSTKMRHDVQNFMKIGHLSSITLSDCIVL